jgi:hypothetical protein
MLNNPTRLKRLKQDYTDGLVEIEGVNSDTAKINVMRYNERTGAKEVRDSQEVHLSDISEAKAGVQELVTLLNQLETVVTDAIENA